MAAGSGRHVTLQEPFEAILPNAVLPSRSPEPQLYRTLTLETDASGPPPPQRVSMSSPMPPEGESGKGSREIWPSRNPSAARINSMLRTWLTGHLRAAADDVAARRARDQKRLKSLSRTPYPMILARIKTLLDRLQVIVHAGLNAAPRTSVRRTTSLAAAPPASLWGGDAEEGGDDAAGGRDSSRLSLDKVVDELGVTFGFVSDFLKRVPDETRLEACLCARLENYKKDQSVYCVGDDADKFYIILSGSVEVWVHPHDQPRTRTVITTHRKGSSFGEQGILNSEQRNEVASPTSNCMFLTVGRSDFLEIFGAWFRSQQRATFEFFSQHVPIFAAVPQDDMQQVVGNMLHSTYAAGKEWEPNSEGQIYFIRDGVCLLEALDRKAVVNVSTTPVKAHPSPEGGEDLPGEPPLQVSEHGVLANVAVVHGRVIGSLGHEEELRRLRRALIPRRTIATLEFGNYFGGGPTVLGDGEMQCCLKVTAESAVEVYHMPVNLFFKQATPDVVRALRDDVAFKLTYYYGRLGTIGLDTVVGHAESTLRVHNEAAASVAPAGRVARSGSTREGGRLRRSRGKNAYVPGELSSEVQKVLSYVSELQGLDPGWRPDLATAPGTPPAMPSSCGGSAGGAGASAPGSAGSSVEDRVARLGAVAAAALAEPSSTPAERFWSHATAGTSKGIALAPLLSNIYPQGLAPLADKIDELIDHTVRRTDSLVSRGASLKPSDTSRIERIRSLSRMGSRISGSITDSSLSPQCGGQLLASSGSSQSVAHGQFSSEGGASSPVRSRLGVPASLGGVGSSCSNGYSGNGGSSTWAWPPPPPPLLTSSRPSTSPLSATDQQRFSTIVRCASLSACGAAGQRLERLLTLGGTSSSSSNSMASFNCAEAPASPLPLGAPRSPVSRLRAISTLAASSPGAPGASGSGHGGHGSAGGYDFSAGGFGEGSGALDAGDSSWSAGNSLTRGEGLSGSRNGRHAHPGSLAAAGVLWEKTSELSVGPPAMRQCLTYGEIKVRAEQKRAIFAAVKSQSARSFGT